MAKVKCKYCGKKIEDNLKVCPKCHKRLVFDFKKFYKSLMYVIWAMLQIVLSVLVLGYSKDILYSDNIKDLYLLMILVGVILVNCILLGCSIFKRRIKKKRKLLLCLLIFIFTLFGMIFSYRIGKAYYYKNSGEILLLAEKYEMNVALKIKDEVESFFEYDEEGSVERNVVISNFYTDGDLTNLYLKDSYGNYTLKFYLTMEDFEIKDAFWLFDDEKLYLIKNGKKTDNFEYYYAMYIVDSVLGEDVKGLARIEDDVESKILKEFDNSANTIFNYEELEFDYTYNTFKLKGDAYNMNFYDDVKEEDFTIKFNKREKRNSKHIWYYGDASFDFVNFDVKN